MYEQRVKEINDLLSAFHCAMQQPSYKDAMAYFEKWSLERDLNEDVYDHAVSIINAHYA